MIAEAKSRGFETLRRENASAWSELWKGRIRIDAEDRQWQELADASYFYLHSSVHSSSPSSTSMFGLSRWHNYHYYRGHVMWDIDAFCVPPLLLTYPAAAESLLGFRARGVDAAWMNARLNGFTGLQYPWEAGPVAGEEAAPGGGDAANHEHHVSMSVALAFVRHFYATGDELYLRDQGWPVIRGVANWLISRVEEASDGCYEIRRVGGVAEKKEPVNNNAFVNMTAILSLRAASEVANILGYQAPALWDEVADHLHLPRASQGHIANHDAYRSQEEKGETPEALAGLFPFGFQLDPALERRTIEYYLRLAPKYVGAPMLSALLGVYAAWVGDRRRSLSLFKDGYASYRLEPFTMIDEYWRKKFPEMPRAAPFVANIGGFLSSLLFGLPGIRTSAEAPPTWCRRPVVLPEGWRNIQVERLWVRGEPWSLSAKHGDEQARLERAE
jgi:trehalose/maltose hydrolase-like predicted phosphorylase